MIDTLFQNIDQRYNEEYDEYLASINGMVYKRISEKNKVYNQVKLTPFYMWTVSGSITSNAYVDRFDQFKFFVSASVDFSLLERDNKNKEHQKKIFHSASMGYVLDKNALSYDQEHTSILYYYGYANKAGLGSPFNVTSSEATIDIPIETQQISPSKLAYYSIKNILNQSGLTTSDRIRILDSFYTDEFVYVKIPRAYYKEEILKGSFSLTLATGSSVLTLNDTSDINTGTELDSISYLTGDSDMIYGLVDRKNAIAIIDVPQLNSYFSMSLFTEASSSVLTKTYERTIYEEYFGVVSVDSTELESYTASYYPNLEVFSHLLYSGSQEQQFRALGLEHQITDEYYIKIGPYEFNRSTNPTYLNGNVIKSEFMFSPITYITSIGLYNDTYDCLAIAKLSKPLKKAEDESYLIRIQLKQ